jgi:hypothetical protein
VSRAAKKARRVRRRAARIIHVPGIKLRDCGGCGARPGERHQLCDVERCALCGGQVIACDCIYEANGMDVENLETEHPDIYHGGPSEEMYPALDAKVTAVGGPLPWTGTWPGDAECVEYGWYSRWVEGRGWVRCEATDEGAGPDLNRLAVSTTWDTETRRYERAKTTAV